MALAVDEARRLNHHYIGTEHLLLGLIREGEGIAAGVLESLGVSLEQVRRQVMQMVNLSGGYGSTPLPRLRRLVRVLPIAQAQQFGDVQVTLLSLEIYDEGFLATLRIVVTGGIPFEDANVTSPIMARDDQDAQYVGHTDWLRLGPDRQWRLTVAFAPGLPSTARQLELEMSPLQWESRSESGVREEHAAGPWLFTIPLHPEEHAE
jgi:hypothetical protein